MRENPYVINLFGGPGCGKSTIAAGLFYKLKCAGIFDCELVTETAKDIIWSGAPHQLANQSYVFGDQYFRLWRLIGKVDIIITDSPILLSINYDVNQSENFANLVVEKFNSFNNLNFYIPRTDYEQPFVLNGRVNDLESSLHKDQEISKTLDKYNISVSRVPGINSEEKTNYIFHEINQIIKTNE